MNVRTLCLGVLSFGDATGYEIKKMAEDGLFSHFIEASFGSIYPALTKMTDEQWQSVIDTNLSGVWNVCKEAVPRLSDGGRIVSMASISAVIGFPGQTNYAAAKAGVVGLTKSLSRELARRQITVNAVAPGFIETRLTAAIPFFTREAARRLSNVSQGGLPEDIAQTIAYLASGASLGLSGSVVRVCGGSLIGA